MALNFQTPLVSLTWLFWMVVWSAVNVNLEKHIEGWWSVVARSRLAELVSTPFHTGYIHSQQYHSFYDVMSSREQVTRGPKWQQLGSFEISIPDPQSSSKRQADAQLNRSITRPVHSQTKPNMTTLTPSSSAGGIAQRTFELANHIQVTPPRPLSSQLTPWYQRSSRRIGWSNWFDRL